MHLKITPLNFSCCSDIDVQAQFSTVNQSRPEEITMKEDLTTIAFVGDDGFGMYQFSSHLQLLLLLHCCFTSMVNI